MICGHIMIRGLPTIMNTGTNQINNSMQLSNVVYNTPKLETYPEIKEKKITIQNNDGYERRESSNAP